MNLFQCAEWRTHPLTRFAAVGVALLLGGGPVFAQSDRAGTFEFGAQLANLSGNSVAGPNGASLDVSNDTAIGIVGGYNFTDRLAIVGELTWGDPSYRAERVRDNGSNTVVSIDGELDVGIALIKGVFHFMEGPFTPYVEAGFGWVTVDSNIVSDTSTGCWWDPWWGYVCTSFYDTYSNTNSAITYAAGFRWDMSDSVLLRASYGITEMDSEFISEDLEFDELRVDLAWKF